MARQASIHEGCHVNSEFSHRAGTLARGRTEPMAEEMYAGEPSFLSPTLMTMRR